ncbi:hypothetical protein Pmar_PMAR027228 [Perkinsus marinus ATCC 50983]|uniref:Uncharacterized protein n=1 Tax=Perkinsus marinus (strain ATCC 50983 / TXsc) TaxID=423536 RepID=C5LWW6_PERM5|nr:hypothetical protein Pmar_PMAR027228 [Perkinsus marinus ATCC 50983]EEQ98744.1 hypothetical protein Pmar_PMAR027228 [Perkinsus marinus ATCC 50983]|eukprot:XP_002766027.1 hypothetical protein Pmar_PMAR027228 [Perkinsus marinus ATCC 50983]
MISCIPLKSSTDAVSLSSAKLIEKAESPCRADDVDDIIQQSSSLNSSLPEIVVLGRLAGVEVDCVVDSASGYSYVATDDTDRLPVSSYKLEHPLAVRVANGSIVEVHSAVSGILELLDALSQATVCSSEICFFEMSTEVGQGFHAERLRSAAVAVRQHCVFCARFCATFPKNWAVPCGGPFFDISSLMKLPAYSVVGIDYVSLAPKTVRLIFAAVHSWMVSRTWAFKVCIWLLARHLKGLYMSAETKKFAVYFASLWLKDRSTRNARGGSRGRAGVLSFAADELVFVKSGKSINPARVVKTLPGSDGVVRRLLVRNIKSGRESTVSHHNVAKSCIESDLQV